MKVFYGIEQFEQVPKTIVTSGTFDGLHYGHRKLIERIKECTEVDKAESVLVTYHPHPRFVLQPDSKHSLLLLTTLDEKIALAAATGIDKMLIIPFDKAFSAITPEEYVQKILINTLHTHKLVIGYDHRFGRNREGNFDYLQKNAARYGFIVEEIPRQDIENIGVSSSKIREALLKGDIKTANHYLGYSYSFTGTVVKGNQIGRTIGFPTANIELSDSFKLIPAEGVYAVHVNHQDKQYKGMLNIGTRPTLSGSAARTIEVNIFDFDEILYGQPLTVTLIDFLRTEKKFASLHELKTQLSEDEQVAKQLLKS
jgi:riboflavin kinase/FMN adenylyltransferase